MTRKKHVLVTGGAGFIGSHLVDALITRGHHVTVFDNFSYGRLDFLRSAMATGYCRIVKGDLTRLHDMTKVLSRKFDTVFHLAANSDIPKGAKSPEWDFQQGTSATFHLLEVMRRRGIKRVAFASTSAVYGETPLRAIPESYGPLQPISFYGASKLAGEGLISSYVHNYGFQAWVFRFGNIIGERATHGAMFDFVKKARGLKRGKFLKVLGDGKQAKPYLYVKDCVEAMLFGWGRSRQPLTLLNLTPKGATTVRDIARWTLQGMGCSRVPIRFGGGTRGWTGDVPQVRLDGSLMRKLGWAPHYSSDQAVRFGIQRHLQSLGLWRPN